MNKITIKVTSRQGYFGLSQKEQLQLLIGTYSASSLCLTATDTQYGTFMDSQYLPLADFLLPFQITLSDKSKHFQGLITTTTQSSDLERLKETDKLMTGRENLTQDLFFQAVTD